MEIQKNGTLEPTLYCLSGSLKGLIVKVGSKPIILGRDQRTCQVIFHFNCFEIAGEHCFLSYDFERQRFVLEDLISDSGTFLNSGEKVSPFRKAYLKTGESFYLGSRENLFEVLDELK